MRPWVKTAVGNLARGQTAARLGAARLMDNQYQPVLVAAGSPRSPPCAVSAKQGGGGSAGKERMR